MATIKAISRSSVHQIQSGQVIVDLCSVVKELLENSLDAGATSIDVRFKAQGLEAIEVQDNGSGVSKADYDTLGMKHYTSKLSSYDDLADLTTFGFRGEALSSLCALSKLSVVTAQDGEAPRGTKLEFETSGKLGQSAIAAAQKGTLVCAESLFQNLPVRRRELEKNIKREYSKVLNVLNAYACICTGVKLSVSNQATKGKKMTVFATKSNPTTKENIANVYGAKTIPALIPLNLKFELEPVMPSQALAEFCTQHDEKTRDVQVVGHMSRPAHGEGRQTPDRQMFFVNSRPCGLPQIAKAFNEVYKSYSVTQSPFVFADLRLNTNTYDVNVSPDKRTIMLHDQPRLIEALKEALITLFGAQDQTIPLSQRPQAKLPSFKPLSVDREALRVSLSPSNTPDLELPKPLTSHTQSTLASSALDSSACVPAGRPVANLTAQFVGRHVKPRPAERTVEDTTGQPSRYTKRMAERLEADDSEGSPASAEAEAVPQPGPEPEIEDAGQVESDAELTGAQARILQDFKDRQASQQANRLQKQTEPRTSINDAPVMNVEESIPSTNTSPRKGSLGVVQNAFDHMRPRQTPMDIATITIGSNTSTTVIGSQHAAKKRRLSPMITSEQRKDTPQPSRFSQGLRAFAAPGTQIGSHEEGLDQEEVESLASSINDIRSEGSVRVLRDSLISEDDQSEADAHAHRVELNVEDADVDDPSDDGYVDEDESRARAEAQARRLIEEAEQTKAVPTRSSLKRATEILKRSSEATVNLVKLVTTSIDDLRHQSSSLNRASMPVEQPTHRQKSQSSYDPQSAVDSKEDPETRLTLTISKSDFAAMRIIGQFNLGFILAVRPCLSQIPQNQAKEDLFIVDQHASDEIYNFHRLSATTQLTPQRLVHPQQLELTAIEEETVLNHAAHSLLLNGFEVSIDESGESPVGQRCRLLSLPTSKDTIFSTQDLEELLVLLADDGGKQSQGQRDVVRPSKVRRMLAMRACRSSIMVGKALTRGQMGRVVRHMGEMERPWNCPHGRPTMRHLTGIGGSGGGSGRLGSWSDDRAEAWEHQEIDEEEMNGVGRSRGMKTATGSIWAVWLESLGRGSPSERSQEEEDLAEEEEGVTSEDVDDGAGDEFDADDQAINELDDGDEHMYEEEVERASTDEKETREADDDEDPPPRTINLSSFRNTAS